MQFIGILVKDFLRLLGVVGGESCPVAVGLCVNSGSQIGELVPYTSSSNMLKNLQRRRQHYDR